MTLEVRSGDWTKPLPAPDPVSTEYWSAAADGILMIQRCPHCDHRQFYPRWLCVRCGTEPEWEEASGRGTIYTFSVIRQNGIPSFTADVPYVVAMIDLEEGPRLMGNVSGCSVDAVRIGMDVHAYVVEAEPGIGIPMWEPIH